MNCHRAVLSYQSVPTQRNERCSLGSLTCLYGLVAKGSLGLSTRRYIIVHQQTDVRFRRIGTWTRWKPANLKRKQDRHIYIYRPTAFLLTPVNRMRVECSIHSRNCGTLTHVAGMKENPSAPDDPPNTISIFTRCSRLKSSLVLRQKWARTPKNRPNRSSDKKKSPERSESKAHLKGSPTSLRPPIQDFSCNSLRKHCSPVAPSCAASCLESPSKLPRNRCKTSPDKENLYPRSSFNFRSLPDHSKPAGYTEIFVFFVNVCCRPALLLSSPSTSLQGKTIGWILIERQAFNVTFLRLKTKNRCGLNFRCKSKTWKTPSETSKSLREQNCTSEVSEGAH